MVRLPTRICIPRPQLVKYNIKIHAIDLPFPGREVEDATEDLDKKICQEPEASPLPASDVPEARNQQTEARPLPVPDVPEPRKKNPESKQCIIRILVAFNRYIIFFTGWIHQVTY